MLQQPTLTRSVGYSLEASCFSVSLREWGLQAAASKRMQLEYVPDVFLIQLKRVSYTAQGAVKLNKHVAFPNTLALANGAWMAIHREGNRCPSPAFGLEWLCKPALPRFEGVEYTLHAGK